MSKRSKVIAFIVYTLAAIALGRYTVPVSIERKTETQSTTVVDEKKSEKKNKSVQKNTVSTTKTVKRPDGTVEIVTVRENKDHINSGSDSTSNTSYSRDEKTTSSEKITKGKGVQIGLLTGVNVSVKDVSYGVYVNYPVLGPITFGGFGFQNGSVGLSLGLQF